MYGQILDATSNEQVDAISDCLICKQHYILAYN